MHLVHSQGSDAVWLCVFCEVTGVEQALKQQIVTAVEPQYIEAL